MVFGTLNQGFVSFQIFVLGLQMEQMLQAQKPTKSVIPSEVLSYSNLMKAGSAMWNPQEPENSIQQPVLSQDLSGLAPSRQGSAKQSKLVVAATPPQMDHRVTNSLAVFGTVPTVLSPTELAVLLTISNNHVK